MYYVIMIWSFLTPLPFVITFSNDLNQTLPFTEPRPPSPPLFLWWLNKWMFPKNKFSGVLWTCVRKINPFFSSLLVLYLIEKQYRFFVFLSIFAFFPIAGWKIEWYFRTYILRNFGISWVILQSFNIFSIFFLGKSIFGKINFNKLEKGFWLQCAILGIQVSTWF